EDSVLAWFYRGSRRRNEVESWCPREVSAAQADAALARAPRGAGYAPLVPWQLALEPGSDRGEHGLGPEHGHQSFGPVSSAKGRMEFARLRATFVSIRDHGYQPARASGEISGLFVVPCDDYRLLIR